jgi:hypothetical protein
VLVVRHAEPVPARSAETRSCTSRMIPRARPVRGTRRLSRPGCHLTARRRCQSSRLSASVRRVAAIALELGARSAPIALSTTCPSRSRRRRSGRPT